MRYTSSPGFDSRWRPNIFNSVLFKKPVKERDNHPANKHSNWTAVAVPLNSIDTKLECLFAGWLS